MKKRLNLLLPLLIGSFITMQAQTKKNPPPPPPKPKNEMVKFTPPKIITDEKIEVREPPVITVKGKEANDFHKRNPSVMEISRQGNIITLKMKDGATEKYDMSKKEEKKDFRDKYGKEPIPDPPPPPKEVS